MKPDKDSKEVICPYCKRPMLDFEIGNHRDPRPKCSAATGCKAWKTIGKSKNGGPLLMVVEERDEWERTAWAAYEESKPDWQKP